MQQTKMSPKWVLKKPKLTVLVNSGEVSINTILQEL